MQIVHVFADATDRLADAIVRTFHNYVHERFRAQGLTGPDLLAASEAVGKPLLDLVEPTLVYFHRRAYQRANREDLLRHLAEPTTPPSTTPGQEQATVLFVDLASFTPLTATMGDHAAAEVLRRFGITVRSSAAQHRGRILRRAAGQFLITETSATRPDIIPQADFTALPRGDSGNSRSDVSCRSPAAHRQPLYPHDGPRVRHAPASRRRRNPNTLDGTECISVARPVSKHSSTTPIASSPLNAVRQAANYRARHRLPEHECSSNTIAVFAQHQTRRGLP